jgi:hypothetical protein
MTVQSIADEATAGMSGDGFPDSVPHCRQQPLHPVRPLFRLLRGLQITISPLEAVPPPTRMLSMAARLLISAPRSPQSPSIFPAVAALRGLRALRVEFPYGEQAICRSDLRHLHSLDNLRELALGAATVADLLDADVLDLLHSLHRLHSLSLQLGLWSPSPQTLIVIGELLPRLRDLTLTIPKEPEPLITALSQPQAFPNLEQLAIERPLPPCSSAYLE